MLCSVLMLLSVTHDINVASENVKYNLMVAYKE